MTTKTCEASGLKISFKLANISLPSASFTFNHFQRQSFAEESTHRPPCSQVSQVCVLTAGITLRALNIDATQNGLLGSVALIRFDPACCVTQEPVVAARPEKCKFSQSVTTCCLQFVFGKSFRFKFDLAFGFLSQTRRRR